MHSIGMSCLRDGGLGRVLFAIFLGVQEDDFLPVDDNYCCEFHC